MYPFPVYPPAQQYTPQMQFNPRGVSQEQFSVIPVSSEEEAKNAIVNPLSTYLFVDCSSGKIFYKKMNSSGKSDFVCYAPVIEHGVKDIDPIEEVNKRLTNIESMLGGIKNVQSVYGDEKNDRVYKKSSWNNDKRGYATNNGTDEDAESPVVSKNAGNDNWKKHEPTS